MSPSKMMHLYNVSANAVMCIASSCDNFAVLDQMNTEYCQRTSSNTTCRGSGTICPNINPKKAASRIAGIVMAGVSGAALLCVTVFYVARCGLRRHEYVQLN